MKPQTALLASASPYALICGLAPSPAEFAEKQRRLLELQQRRGDVMRTALSEDQPEIRVEYVGNAQFG